MYRSPQARTKIRTSWGCGTGWRRCHQCCTVGMLTGKYSADSLPKGPRGLLFRQILPGIEPLTDVVQQVAASRRKTPSQVRVAGPSGGGVAADACLLTSVLSRRTRSTLEHCRIAWCWPRMQGAVRNWQLWGACRWPSTGAWRRARCRFQAPRTWPRQGSTPLPRMTTMRHPAGQTVQTDLDSASGSKSDVQKDSLPDDVGRGQPRRPWLAAVRWGGAGPQQRS